jgi:hypothetical protein
MQLRNFHAVGPQCFFRIGLRSTLDTRWIERSDVPIGSDAWTEKLDRVGETPSFLLRHPLSLKPLSLTVLAGKFIASRPVPDFPGRR